jgi:hypothetical protein
MLRKFKYGKLLVVSLITVLIWVWADLALDEKLPVSNVTISVAKSTNRSLLVSLNNERQTTLSINNVVLKGPASKIGEVRRKLNVGLLEFEFFFDPEAEGTTEPGSHLLNIPDFLRKSEQIKKLGLTVETCEPENVTVNVVKLVKKSLAVQCLDESKIPLKAESIEPANVEMFVPDDWQGEKLIAYAQLTRREISQAMLAAISKVPYIELPAGQLRQSTTAVEVKMPPAEELLKDYTITTATLGLSLSENLQGKYKVQVTNLSEVMSPIAIKATPEAKQAYESMRYQVILEIDDKDVKTDSPRGEATGECRREVVYNFPEEFVSREEISLNQTPVQARFKLVPISAETE